MGGDSFLRSRTAPSTVCDGSAEPRRAAPALSPRPQEDTADIARSVHVPVPCCAAFFAMLHPEQFWSRSPVGIAFSPNSTEIPALQCQPDPPNPAIHTTAHISLFASLS